MNMTESLDQASVFLIDTDPSFRDSTSQLLQSMQIHVEAFSSAEEFLAKLRRNMSGCIISDLHLRGISGLELQTKLLQQRNPLPILFCSSHATTQLVVRAMRNGAVAFLDKPVNEDELWLSVREALAVGNERRAQFLRVHDLGTRFASLSDQEKKVLEMMGQGLTNKEIASALDVSVRTVESRRQQLFQKTATRNLPELIVAHEELRRVAKPHLGISFPPLVGPGEGSFTVI